MSGSKVPEASPEKSAADWDWLEISGTPDTTRAPWDGKYYLVFDETCENEFYSDRWDAKNGEWDLDPEGRPSHYCIPQRPRTKRDAQ